MTISPLQQATHALREGGVIAYPTEAVWGLGCDPENEAAVMALLNLKHRAVEKGLILVAANIDQFAPYLTELTAQQYQQLQASWPSFQTWVVPASQVVPHWLRGNHSGIALRVSAHPLVRELCQSFGGPLVSTSANPSTEPAALNIEQVKHYFSDQLAFMLPGDVSHAGAPSPIVDIRTGKPLR